MRIDFIRLLYAHILNYFIFQKHCGCIETNPEYFENFNDDAKDWSDVFPTTSRPISRWVGTKPPFPRTTAEVCTKKFVVQFPEQVVQLPHGHKVIVRRYPIQVTKQLFNFPQKVLTLFELLDEIIYTSLENPEPGYSEDLMKKIDMFYYYLQLVKGMYIDKKEDKLEALRYSVYMLILNKGGPTFTGFPINIPESRKKLVDAFKWTDKDLEVLKKRLKIVESTWYRVQMNIFDMNQLLQLRQQINATKKITTVRPNYNHQPPKRWIVVG